MYQAKKKVADYPWRVTVTVENENYRYDTRQKVYFKDKDTAVAFIAAIKKILDDAFVADNPSRTIISEVTIGTGRKAATIRLPHSFVIFGRLTSHKETLKKYAQSGWVKIPVDYDPNGVSSTTTRYHEVPLDEDIAEYADDD